MKPSLLTRVALVVALVALAVPTAFAATPDDELWLPTAGHGPGAQGSFWVTDIYIMNPHEDAVSVMITFLPLGIDNTDTEGEIFEIEGESLLVLNDVVEQLSEEETTFGALHIEIVEEDESDEEQMLIWLQQEQKAEDIFDGDTPVMVYARVYDRGGEGTRGQAIEGYTSQSAITAGSSAPATRVIGVASNADYRSNWFGINISENENEEPVAADVLVELLDEEGEIVGSMSYAIPARSPIFASVSDLGSVEDGVLKFTMQSGSAIFGASKIDNISNDGTTLESFWNSIDPRDQHFTDSFNTDTCTWSATGFNPYFPLQPGIRLVLEAEDEGEVEQVIIETTDQTKMVDGVMTRVIVETESIDGELTEISTNYFAECSETRDVYYFGEDVDIYEDGEVVSHDGAWLAGENGNRPGIIMPGGTPLVGSRYYQEVAPGVALDRAEHLAVGQTVETEAGTFENCLITFDTNALAPTEGGDSKAYCPGLGLIRDEDLELVEMVIPN